MKLGNALTDWSSSQKNRESQYSAIKSHIFYTFNAVFIFILNEIISYMARCGRINKEHGVRATLAPYALVVAL